MVPGAVDHGGESPLSENPGPFYHPGPGSDPIHEQTPQSPGTALPDRCAILPDGRRPPPGITVSMTVPHSGGSVTGFLGICCTRPGQKQGKHQIKQGHACQDNQQVYHIWQQDGIRYLHQGVPFIGLPATRALCQTWGGLSSGRWKNLQLERVQYKIVTAGHGGRPAGGCLLPARNPWRGLRQSVNKQPPAGLRPCMGLPLFSIDTRQYGRISSHQVCVAV